MEELKFLLSSLYCGLQDFFMCFGLLSGADLLGILSKILMIWNVHLLSLLVHNLCNFQFLLQKKTQKRNLIFGLQHWCHSRREFRCTVQHVKNGPQLSWVLCAHMFIASPFTFSAGLSPLSGITGILGEGGILCIVRSPGKKLFVSCSSSYETSC
jgi:hypothetical protein